MSNATLRVSLLDKLRAIIPVALLLIDTASICACVRVVVSDVFVYSIAPDFAWGVFSAHDRQHRPMSEDSIAKYFIALRFYR